MVRETGRRVQVVALTNSNPGTRYSSLIATCREAGAEVLCVELDGIAEKLARVQQHWKILRNRGPRGYLKRRRTIREAAALRQDAHEIAARACVDCGIATVLPAIDQRFSGYNATAVKWIRQIQPDLILQAGVGIIPGKFIQKVPPILNMHPGILPGLRGVDPLFWAHYYGRPEWLGSTLHIVDAGIDSGRRIASRTFEPQPGCHYAKLIPRQVEIECALLRELVEKLMAGSCLSELNQPATENTRQIYRSFWSAARYQELREADWWAAADLPTPVSD